MKKKIDFKLLLKLLFISFIFLLIGSKNSFLYKINDWYDANSFMSVAKGILHGLVPYKDLFEQKGPILYLIYTIGALISDTSFIGIFILEVISYTVFLYYARKTICLLAKDQYSTFALIILTGFVMLLRPFGHGGAAEEFMFPILMISIYYFTNYLYTGKITNKQMILNGIMAGIILWTKYSLLGFHIFFTLAIFAITIYKGKIIEAFKKVLFYLLGMLIVTIPVILIFFLVGGLKSLFKVYFIINMTAYSSNETIIQKLLLALSRIGEVLITNIPYILFLIIPTIVLLFRKSKFKIRGSKIILFLSFVALALGCFIGGKAYFYYSLPFVPFMVSGALALVYGLHYINFKMNIIREISAVLFMAGIVLLFGQYTSYITKTNNDYAQYRFLNIINKEKDKSIINYGFLDGGFYLTTNTTPHYYYFMRNNLRYANYPVMFKKQKSYVKKDKPMFVVTKKEYEFLKEDYIVVDKYQQNYESKEVNYYLYQKKNNLIN